MYNTTDYITIIFIRHAKKLYKNGKNPSNKYPKHDSPLKYGEHLSIKNISDYIVYNFGVPNFIFVSPFKRTRQTLDLLRENINIDDSNISVDSEISEYLGFCKDNILDVYSCTSEYTIFPPNENEINFDKRINNFIKKLGLLDFNINPIYLKSDKNVILIITHGYIIKTIYEKLFNEKINRPKELGGFYISGNLSIVNSFGCFG